MQLFYGLRTTLEVSWSSLATLLKRSEQDRSVNASDPHFTTNAPGEPTSRLATQHSYLTDVCETHPGSNSLSDIEENDLSPFHTGSLDLSLSGNLHLSPQATFYHPADTDFSKISSASGAEAFLSGSPYLPIHLEKENHLRLIDLCFEHTCSYGQNSNRDKFLDEMEHYPSGKGHYFSPLLHLVILAIGLRYCRDRAVIASCDPSGYDARGTLFIERAKSIMLQETTDASLGTISALFLMSLYYIGLTEE
jgi:hypothetical protein